MTERDGRPVLQRLPSVACRRRGEDRFPRCDPDWLVANGGELEKDDPLTGRSLPRLPADDVITLREVTEANISAVEQLRVRAGQEVFVDDVVSSLAEARSKPASRPWYRAVYADDIPVGFLMIRDGVPSEDEPIRWPYYLWRMLIDGRYQGRGYGRSALDRLVEYLRTRPGAEELVTSVIPGEGSPLGFYLRYGFEETGEWFDHEKVLRLTLNRSKANTP